MLVYEHQEEKTHQWYRISTQHQQEPFKSVDVCVGGKNLQHAPLQLETRCWAHKFLCVWVQTKMYTIKQIACITLINPTSQSLKVMILAADKANFVGYLSRCWLNCQEWIQRQPKKRPLLDKRRPDSSPHCHVGEDKSLSKGTPCIFVLFIPPRSHSCTFALKLHLRWF